MGTGILGSNKAVLGSTLVLGAGFGSAAYDLEATSTVVFTSDAEGYTLADDMVQSVTFTSDVACTGDFEHSNTDTLSFTSVADGEVVVELEDTVTFTSEADADVVQRIVQTINFTSEASATQDDYENDDTLEFTSDVGVTGPWYNSAVDDLTGDLTYVFDPNTNTLVEVPTGLHVTADAVIDKALSASSQINFTQSAVGYVLSGPGVEDDASSTVTFTQRADDAEWEDDSSFIDITSAADATVGQKTDAHLIEFTSEATVTGSSSEDIESTIEFTSSFTFVHLKSNTHTTYSPFIGDGPGEKPPASYQAAQGTPGFRLQYPETGTVTEEWISPRKPNFGNVQRIALTRINRLTRGGTLDVYRDPIWPKTETLLYSISSLTRQKAKDLLQFMDDYIGLEVRLIDQEDRLWRGIVTVPNDPMVQDGRGSCNFTVSFEFQGELVA